MEENSKEIKDLPPGLGLAPTKQENAPKSPAKRGRPKGAKNKDTLFKELMSGQFQEIAEVNIRKTFEVLFEEAHEGNMQAIKMVLDRVVPVTKAVDLADMEKKGLTISINVGNLEDTTVVAEEVVEAEFEEIEDEG